MTTLTKGFIGLICAFLISSCGKSGGVLQSDTTPVPVAPNPLDTANLTDLTAAKKLTSNLTNNVTACPADLSSTQLLGSFDKGQASCAAGNSLNLDSLTGTQCSKYASQAAGNLGVMACRKIFSPEEVRAWLQRLLDWAALRNKPASTTPAPTAVASTKKMGIAVAYFSAPENTHVVGGHECATTTKFAGGFADCGMGRCFGNQTMCVLPSEIDTDAANAAAVPTVLDIKVTAEGAHVVGGPGCPSGYQAYGSGADCGGGRCNGNQLFCSRSLPNNQIQSGQTFVKDVKITAEGTHVVGGPGCPSGYQAVGSIADCGGGNCFGNQLICVQYDKL